MDNDFEKNLTTAQIKEMKEYNYELSPLEPEPVHTIEIKESFVTSDLVITIVDDEGKVLHKITIDDIKALKACEE